MRDGSHLACGCEEFTSSVASSTVLAAHVCGRWTQKWFDKWRGGGRHNGRRRSWSLRGLGRFKLRACSYSTDWAVSYRWSVRWKGMRWDPTNHYKCVSRERPGHQETNGPGGARLEREEEETVTDEAKITRFWVWACVDRWGVGKIFLAVRGWLGVSAPTGEDIYGIKEGEAMSWLQLHMDSTIAASYSLWTLLPGSHNWNKARSLILKGVQWKSFIHYHSTIWAIW